MTRAHVAAAIAAACVLTAQAPASVPTTLPEIGRTHSKGLCTTVRDSVAPMVLGLMKSDEIVGAGHRALLKMSQDQRTGSREALDLDQVYLHRVSDAMAHNLVIIDKLLRDEKRFPKKAASDDDRIAQLLKEQIQAVADRQRRALNTLSGSLDTEDLGRMQNEFPGGISSINSTTGPKGALQNGPRGPDASGSFIGAAGLTMPQYMTMEPRTLGSSNTAGHTAWDRLANVIETQQASIAGAEQQLSPTVIAISVACRNELSPAATPSP